MTSIPTITVRVPRTGPAGHKGTLAIGDWSVPCVVGTGGLVAASVKREGDRKTPIGVFPLRYGLFKPLPALRFLESVSFPFVPCSDDMIWEEDGPDYNRLVFADGADRPGDRLARPRDHDLFNVIVPIGYNDAVAEAGRGSALFVHAARPDMSGTAGCVALRPDDLLELARRLKPGMVIDIDYEAAPAQTVRADDASPIETVSFAALHPGPKLLVTGAVHGNEICGPEAISRVIADCRSGKIAIRRGQVTFVPIVNMKAYRANTREGDRNLNRNLRPRDNPKDNEDLVGNVLCALLREHEVLLDIHSFRSQGKPFVFVGPEDNDGEIEPFRLSGPESELALRLGPDIIMHGWMPAYARAALERRRRGGAGDPTEGIGTTEYMRSVGGYGVTLECGNHGDPRAVEVAYHAIVNALGQLGLIDAQPSKAKLEKTIEIVDAVLCDAAGDRLAREFVTGDAVRSGETIVVRADGSRMTAPSNGFVVFPDRNARAMDVICYFGVPSKRFG
ncbi:L,D-transpeptidase family protein [Bradyrhizobium sp.]|uniref:L,D-transpeptidase family protein n=1 Tax=Bradyrhizobium sp. TaxID=376 RepID=UPI002D26A07C|nr:succinylglutamate desuccinylase/aspartoacylase family protein [Bradyrhizobium sp.]HZR75913.1 succinylglutamate desuccinylase/aspartoacylase family protein [Bradyrhizobium sp.]